MGDAAKLDFAQQRAELVKVRRRLEADWITPQNKAELLQLTARIHGLMAGGIDPPADQVERFQELANKFRLYDFLNVTAGIDEADIRKDYRNLYKYPAAPSYADFAKLRDIVVSVVPPREIQAVVYAQQSLINHALDALNSGQYLP